MIERIILHAGTPKTGTTALQIALQDLRDALALHGIFIPPTEGQAYPTPDGRLAMKPKHQWLVGALMAPTTETLNARLREALALASPDDHTAVLSTEGLYHHWWDFSEAGKSGLAALKQRYRVELWVWFRSPDEFFRSSYVQMLKNPIGPVACYGKDLSPEQLLADPWFAKRLDYASFVQEATEVLGRDALRLFAWRGRTVGDFLAALGHNDLARDEPSEHPTLGAVGVAMLRLVNARAVPNSVKAEAVRLISLLDATLGFDSPMFNPGPEARERVAALSAPSLAWLRQEWGFDLTKAPC